MRLIDADATMRKFDEFVKASNNSDFAKVPTWNDAVSLLGSAQTIDPVKHGEWIKMSDADGVYWACSECGEGLPRGQLRSISCPNCGARMNKAKKLYEETISKEEEEYIKMDIDTTKSTFLEYYKNGCLTAPIQSVTISTGRIDGKSITTDSSINMTSSVKIPNKFAAQTLGILPKKVIYRDKYTIVIWEDGTKTIVKCSDGDTFDKEKGFLMALTTYMYGKGVMDYLRKECCEKVEKEV